MILAPLRGVTVRCFRKTFMGAIREAGFTEAITPFISATAGLNPLKDHELAGFTPVSGFRVTPQFIGKDPEALRRCLLRIREAGFSTADLNCGCPFPMVRNKGRGSGLLKTPDTLRRMLEVGCETMGEGRFSVKARLGVDRPDELLALMPLINCFPLRFLTVHARVARQMYSGECDATAFAAVRAVAKVPVVANGDLDWRAGEGMVGRGFIRDLGTRMDIWKLVRNYVAASQEELCGDQPVLGRMKELVAYWKDLPQWRQRWEVIKVSRSVEEFLSVI